MWGGCAVGGDSFCGGFGAVQGGCLCCAGPREGCPHYRVWCACGLHHLLALPPHKGARAARNYTCGMCTAPNWGGAVGISGGKAAASLGANDKLPRAAAGAPLASCLVDQVLGIECRKPKASRGGGRSRTLAGVGGQHGALGCVPHGVSAKVGIAFAMGPCHAVVGGVAFGGSLGMGMPRAYGGTAS